MKTIKQTICSVFALLLLSQQFLHAQNCPPPVDFQIEIIQTVPPVAHLSWSAPPGAQVTGYILSYSIDNQTPVTVNLSDQVTFYDITLPESWTTFEANIITVCANGENSGSETVRTDNLIIIDLVLALTVPGQEPQVCNNACLRATHFGYTSQLASLEGRLTTKTVEGSVQDEPDTENGTGASSSIDGTTPLVMNFYNIQRFCGCMSNFGGDPSQINRCKNTASDLINLTQSTVQLCTGISAPRNLGDAPKNLASIYPNPFGEALVLRLQPQTSAGIFRLFDAKGQEVYTRKTSPGNLPQEIVINPSSLANGLYAYQIRLNDGSFQSGKLIKQ